MFGSVDLILIKFCENAKMNSQDVLLYIAVILCPSSNSVHSRAFLRQIISIQGTNMLNLKGTK